MPGQLASHVHVRDDQSTNHVFGPGDEIPLWAARKITNPGAWAQAPEPWELEDQAADPQDGDPQDETGPGQSPGGMPALSDTKDVWQAFAAVRGVELPDGATKTQIIEVVKAADQQ